MCVLDKLFKYVCWFVLVSGLCFGNALQIILAFFWEICGDSVLIFLIDLFSNLLVLDVRINLYVVLLFLFFWCRMLFNNENMLVEIICIGDRFVVAFVFSGINV